MREKWLKRSGWVLAAAFGVAGATWFVWPRPIAVDLAIVTTGPMEVTVDDVGKTRVRHIYTVSAPVTGTVLRISHPDGHQCGATIWVRILRRSEEPYWRSRLVDDCRGATRLQGVF